jgi:hypothetical protein
MISNGPCTPKLNKNPNVTAEFAKIVAQFRIGTVPQLMSKIPAGSKMRFHYATLKMDWGSILGHDGHLPHGNSAN